MKRRGSQQKQSRSSESGLLDWQTNLLGDARTVLGINLVEVRENALLDVAAALAQATGDVVDGLLAHGVVEDVAEEGARLLVVGVGVLVGVASRLALELLLGPSVSRVLDRSTANGVWLVVGLGAIATIDGHEAVTGVVVTHAGAVGAVDRDLVVVGSQSVPVRVGVVHETTLQHLVVGGLDAWHHMGGGEGGLLGLSMVVLGVLVEDELADLLERVVAVRPNLGHIVDVESVFVGVRDRHDLGVPGPRGVLALLDGVEEVHGGVVLGDLAHLGGLTSGEVLDALVRLVVVLDEELLVLGVDPLESVRAVSVHVPVAVRGAAIRHQDGDLVESLWGVAPEVPSHVGVLHTRLRVSLLAVDEVRELDRVLDKEHGGVVTDHVVVALLRIVLDGETARVTVAIVGTALAGDSRESQENGGSLADGVHEGGLGEPNHIRIRASQG